MLGIDNVTRRTEVGREGFEPLRHSGTLRPRGRRQRGRGRHLIREFTTERLQLRPLGPSDETLYCRLYTDPALMRHIGPPLSGMAAQRAFLVARRQTAVANPTAHVWAIDWQAAPIGIAACVRRPEIPDEAELGLMLVEEAQGVGLAAEALTALTDRMFATFRLRRIWTRHAPANLASVRLMRTMRFSPWLTTADEIRWQMPSSQWHARRPVGATEELRPFAQVAGLPDAAGNP